MTEGHCSLVSQMHMFAFAFMSERKSQNEVSAPAGHASGFDCEEVSFLADFPKVTAKHDRKPCRWGREKTGAQHVLFLNFLSIAFTWEQAACGLLGGMLVGLPWLDLCQQSLGPQTPQCDGAVPVISGEGTPPLGPRHTQ